MTQVPTFKQALKMDYDELDITTKNIAKTLVCLGPLTPSILHNAWSRLTWQARKEQQDLEARRELRDVLSTARAFE